MILMLFFFSLYLIDQPDIDVLGHGIYSVQMRFGPEGEILGFGTIGLWDRICGGMSYGASNLIGAGNPEFYKQIGIQFRILVIEEGLLNPTLILGFDNQGYGPFDDETKRYKIMSKGIYSQLGKNFEYPGLTFCPSIGINYSFEDEGRLDIFGGVKFELGNTFRFLTEYTPNFMDQQDQNKGFLNTAIRFVFYEELFFEFALRDLFENYEGDQLNRMIKIGYQQSF